MHHQPFARAPPLPVPALQALQEPLGVALGALEEVEAFRQALVQHDVARVRACGGCFRGVLLMGRRRCRPRGCTVFVGWAGCATGAR